MACNTKITALEELRRLNITDDVNRIDPNMMDQFNLYNRDITKLAEVKYGVRTDNETMFTIHRQDTKLMRGSSYMRDNIKTSYFVRPNEGLFDQLQMNVENRNIDQIAFASKFNEDEDEPIDVLENENFSQELNDVLKDTLQNLYPEIQLKYTNVPILPGEGLFNQRATAIRNINYRLKVADALVKMSEPKETKRTRKYNEVTDAERVTLRLNTATQPNIETNIRKTLSKKGVPTAQIDYVFDYMKSRNIQEINAADLAIKLMEEYQFAAKLMNIENPSFENLTINTGLPSTSAEQGTDYRVTTIDFPELLPNERLRAHQSVTTKNSVGWFRSDTVEDHGLVSKSGPIPAKILRIQEVQSDHFQKARRQKISLLEEGIFNKKTAEIFEYFKSIGFKKIKVGQKFLVKETWFEVASPYDQTTGTRIIRNLKNNRTSYLNSDTFFKAVEKNNTKEIDEKANNFLNILLDQDRWVKFFIKTIIQDAAEKGFDYVRFPTGDTIINIESSGRYMTAQDVREANGPSNLIGTGNFYENKLNDNLNKMYGKDARYYVDSEGIDWVQIRVDNIRDLNPIMLQQDKDRIIGQANIKALSVLIDTTNQKQDTLPHEYAHHYIAWFRNTDIVKEGIKKFGSEEALVQAIGEQAVEQKGEAWTWWQNFVKFIQDLFNNVSDLTKEEIKNILTDAFLQRTDLDSGGALTKEKILARSKSTYQVNEDTSDITLGYTSNENGFDVKFNDETIGNMTFKMDGSFATLDKLNISTQASLELYQKLAMALGRNLMMTGLQLRSGKLTGSAEKVWEGLRDKGHAYKIEDEYFYTDQELDQFVRVIPVDEAGYSKLRSKEIVNIIADRLSKGLKTGYAIVSEETAKEVLKNRVIGYNGQTSFILGGMIYFVEGTFNLDTVMHEFSHPLLGAIRRENPTLFMNLYNSLALTDEFEDLKAMMKRLYPELEEGTPLYMEEIMSHALQKKAVNSVTEQIESEGFIGFIKRLLTALKQMFRDQFGDKVNVSDLNESTTLKELADMLLTKDFQYDTERMTEEDILMFGKDTIERSNELSETASQSTMQNLINTAYGINLDLLQRIPDASKSSDYKALREAVYKKNGYKLLPKTVEILDKFQTINEKGRNKQDIMAQIKDTAEREQKELEDMKSRALDFVTSMEVTLDVVKNISEDLAVMMSEKNISGRSALAKINIYHQMLEAYDIMIKDMFELLNEENLPTDNMMGSLLNQIRNETEKAKSKIIKMFEESDVDFYLDVTQYMQKYLETELKDTLAPLKDFLTEDEFDAFYEKAKDGKIVDEFDLLASKGVPVNIVKEIVGEYDHFKIDSTKIKDALRGDLKDIAWGNRFLESYTSANDPVVGGFAIYVQNLKTKAQQEALRQSREFRSELEDALAKVNVSFNNTNGMLDLLMDKDSVLEFDKEGKPVKWDVFTLKNEFTNAWRYDLDMLKYNLKKAVDEENKDEITKAKTELSQFIKDYMWTDVLPVVYEADELFETEVGKRAWLEKSEKLNKFTSFNNSIESEIERFEKYSTIQALWEDYQRIYDLNYFDGTPKIDDPEKGIYDLSIATTLRKHREMNKKYYEFVPREGSLDDAYNTWANEQEASGVKRGSDQWDLNFREFEKQNIKTAYDSAYFERKRKAVDTIRELEDKKTTKAAVDVSGAFERIFDLIYTYRDEQGQPKPGSIGAERLIEIRDLQQKIADFKNEQEKNDKLTSEQRDELKALIVAIKSTPETVSRKDMDRYRELLSLQSPDGLTPLEQARLEGAYAELSELSSKIPTEYYMDALNFHLERIGVPPTMDTTVDEYVNSTEFQKLLAADNELAKWFYANHITKMRYSKGQKPSSVFERIYAHSVSVPTDEAMYIKTKVLDTATGEEVTFNGLPNSRHTIYRVKNEFRSIPFGEKRENYIGTVINNKYEFLPRPYTGAGDSNSAKDDKYVNKEYLQMKRNNTSEYQFIEFVKKHFLSWQKGKPKHSKLYLDMPRYGADDTLQAFQAGKYNNALSNATSTLKRIGQSAIFKAQDDFNRGMNYDPTKNTYVNTDALNREISYVPVTGLYKIDSNEIDKDVFGVMGKYLMSVENQVAMIEALPRYESIVKTLESNPPGTGAMSKQSKQRKGQNVKATKKGQVYGRLAAIRGLGEREIYGVQVSAGADQYVFLTKLMGNLMKIGSATTLGLNIPSALKNRYGQIVQNVIEAAGGEFVNLKDLAMGRIWAATTMMNWSARDIYAKGNGSLTSQLIENMDATFRTEEQLGRAPSRTMLKDFLNGEWITDFRKGAEMEAALQLFGATLIHQKVEERASDGTVIYRNYMDAWELDSNGIIKLKDNIDPDWGNKEIFHIYELGDTLESIARKYSTTVEKLKERNKIEKLSDLKEGAEILITKGNSFMQFKNRFQGLSRKLYGNYDKFGQPEANKYLTYRAFMFMRKWTTPMSVNRWGLDLRRGDGYFGRGRYDWAMGTVEIGGYVRTFKAMLKFVKHGLKYYNWMSPREKAEFRRNFMSFMMMLSMVLIATMIYGYDEDDDDRFKKLKARSDVWGTEGFNWEGFIANHLLILNLGVLAETTTFVPIPTLFNVNFGLDDYTKFIGTSTSVFSNTANVYMKLMEDATNWLTGDEDAYYKRNEGEYWWQKKGTAKIWKDLFKTVGFTGATGDTEKLLESMENQQKLR